MSFKVSLVTPNMMHSECNGCNTKDSNEMGTQVTIKNVLMH